MFRLLAFLHDKKVFTSDFSKDVVGYEKKVHLEQNIANRDSVNLNLLLQQSAAIISTNTVCMTQISTYVAKVCVAMYATGQELCIFI
jgi:hypothetical protein